MQKMNFKTTIHAPKEAVWKVLWTDRSYREWTRAFCEGSYAVTDDWKEGTEVKFLDPAGSGMISRVAENRPNEYMSFEHLGELTKGVEDRTSDKVKAWAGAKENYTLTGTGNVTELVVELDMADEYAEMFRQMWPKAMDSIKALAEQTSKN